MANHPRWRKRASTVSTDRWRTRRFSRHPAARTRYSAITALMVLATTAISTPNAGPNSSPAARVKAVRGTGTIVTTTCATRNANGNHGPTDSAQSRIRTGEGSGIQVAAAISTVIPTTVATIRGRDSWRAEAPIAHARSRSVSVILQVAEAVTRPKVTGPR